MTELVASESDTNEGTVVSNSTSKTYFINCLKKVMTQKRLREASKVVVSSMSKGPEAVGSG